MAAALAHTRGRMADSDAEGAGESCWPPVAASHGGGGGGVQLSGVRREIYDRLRAAGNQEALADPWFDRALEDHYERLPSSYCIDLDVNKVEDVLLHRRILAECAADPGNRPVFHARFLRCLQKDKPPEVGSAPNENANCGGSPAPNLSNGEFKGYDACERMMEGLSLGPRKAVDEAISARSFSISWNVWLPTVSLKYNHAFLRICKSS